MGKNVVLSLLSTNLSQYYLSTMDDFKQLTYYCIDDFSFLGHPTIVVGYFNRVFDSKWQNRKVSNALVNTP